VTGDHVGWWQLPRDTSSAAAARDLVARAVGDGDRTDDIVLVTSELVTNAVRYGTGPIDVTLTSAPWLLRLEVSSPSATGEPIVRVPGPADPGGRGLALVQALTSRWGWERSAERLAVWAEFDRT
jgi:anti-sigma regulatory factor (Ser/Thr protein kinase)